MERIGIEIDVAEDGRNLGVDVHCNSTNVQVLGRLAPQHQPQRLAGWCYSRLSPVSSITRFRLVLSAAM